MWGTDPNDAQGLYLALHSVINSVGLEGEHIDAWGSNPNWSHVKKMLYMLYYLSSQLPGFKKNKNNVIYYYVEGCGDYLFE